jgi:hypothetical protein
MNYAYRAIALGESRDKDLYKIIIFIKLLTFKTTNNKDS